jgi:hypothetical protein
MTGDEAIFNGVEAQRLTLPKKFPSEKSPGKKFSSIFEDQESILHIDYLPKVQTINAEYYSSLLVQSKDILKEKRCGSFTKVVLLLQGYGPAHQA